MGNIRIQNLRPLNKCYGMNENHFFQNYTLLGRTVKPYSKRTVVIQPRMREAPDGKALMLTPTKLQSRSRYVQPFIRRVEGFCDTLHSTKLCLKNHDLCSMLQRPGRFIVLIMDTVESFRLQLQIELPFQGQDLHIACPPDAPELLHRQLGGRKCAAPVLMANLACATNVMVRGRNK